MGKIENDSAGNQPLEDRVMNAAGERSESENRKDKNGRNKINCAIHGIW